MSHYLDPLGRGPDELLDAWWTLVDVAGAARRAGVDVTVVQAAAADATVDRDGVTFHFVAEPREWPLRRAVGLWALPLRRRVARRVASLKPQVIHVQGLGFPRHVRFLARNAPGAPILVQDRRDAPPPRWRRAIHRRGLAGAAGLAFTARELAEPFVSARVIPPDLPVFEVVGGSSRFTPGDQTAARRATGLHGDPCLIWLAHLNENKDPLCVLAALSLARPALRDPQLWCCFGSAPLREFVERRIRDDPALIGRVHLLGARPHDEVERLLRAADFLVQGSHAEGSGPAVIEALACGTTPLVTDIPSLRRITGAGAAGALSPPGDAEAMARALVTWAARDRAALRRAARAHFDAQLSLDAMGRQLRGAYEALARGAAR